MKILSSPLNNISFGSRKKEIKEADKIERKAKETFPMISQSRADDYYLCTKHNSKNRFKAQKYTDRIWRKIQTMRDTAQYPDFYKPEIPEIDREVLYAINLNEMKRLKAGNCKEHAMAAVAALCANGYYNTERVELYYTIDFKNKETGEIEHGSRYPMDHSFALTDMKKGNDKGEKRNIVVDPWLGFADYKSGAIARFKQIYTQRDMKEASSYIRNEFCCKKKITSRELAERYETNEHFSFVPSEPYTTPYQLRRLGEYARDKYEGILTDENV